MKTIELVQKLLKTKSNNLGELDDLFTSYKEKQITYMCANIDVNSNEDSIILKELKKRRLDTDDDFFKKYNKFKSENV